MIATVEAPVALTKSRVMKPVKRKILLVDDDPAMRRVLSRLLADEDFLVLTAANGVEALQLANMTRFDLVVLDLAMPLEVEDEWGTFRRLAAQNPLLPVLLIADRPDDRFFHALASDVGVLLRRPLNFTKLFHTIHSLLEESDEGCLAHFGNHSSVFQHIPPTDGVPGKVWRAN